jgi:hypothetical protein
MNKYCQGPKCHTYQTTDRKRGPKGDKYFQTRTISTYSYGDQSFCTLTCQNDWWTKHGTQAIDHFGRLREPIKLTEESAWVKTCDYHWDSDNDNFRFFNKLTNERIPLTEAQYDDNNYTIERAR